MMETWESQQNNEKQRGKKSKKGGKRASKATNVEQRANDNKERDLELFMQELEEDPELRQHVNIYADDGAVANPSTAEYEETETRLKKMNIETVETRPKLVKNKKSKKQN